MLHPSTRIVLVLIALASLAAAPPPKGLAQKMSQLRAFEKEMRKHEYSNPAAAIAPAEKWLALLGEVNGDIDHGHWQLAWLYGKVNQPGKRLDHLRRRVKVRIARYGADHWQTTDARLEAEAEERKQRLTDAERRQEGIAGRLWGEMRARRRENKIHEALAAAREAAPACRKAYGEKSLDYADFLSDAANLYQAAGDFARAEPLRQEVKRIRKARLGERHPQYIGALNNLALLCRDQGDYTAAERELRQAFALIRPLYQEISSSRGAYHPLASQYATIVNNLALLYHATGQYDRAEPMYREAVAAYANSVGRAHYEYATCLDNLGSLYHSMGDLASGERLLQEALRVRRFLLDYEFLVSMAGGNVHKDHALTLNNLGMLYKDKKDYSRALSMLRQSASIRKKLVGENHPDYALAANNLAALLRDKGDYEEALKLQKLAVDVWKRTLGEKHVLYGNGLHNLAAQYAAQGKVDLARSTWKKAHSVYKQAVGEMHPNYARSLLELARLSWQAGDVKQAWREVSQATEVTRRHLERTAAAQSERQQLLMNRAFRPALDRELAISVAAGRPAGEVYTDVLAWKGAVSARQLYTRRMRQASAGKNTKLSRLFADLSRSTRELSSLAAAVSAGVRVADRERRMQQLSSRIEETEKALAAASVDFRQLLQRRRLPPVELAKSLPADAALVDLLEYEQGQPPRKAGEKWSVEKRLTAFVLRPGKATARIDLGSAKRISLAIEQWRASFTAPFVKRGAGAKVAAHLRKLLWLPLTPYLKDVKTVLISPDGAAARLPWGALPGSSQGSYLLEELALAVVPIPQLLPEMLQRGAPAPEDSLLVVGDVDYDAEGRNEGLLAARSPARTGESWRWGRLFSTKAEIDGVAAAFASRFPRGAATKLRGNRPTVDAIRVSAPRYRFLHFATHGYFAPATVASALGERGEKESSSSEVMGFHPGLLSGLVLAGANGKPDLEHEGVLTALDVSALDLSRTELAVLSACETGLGEVAGGEGVLGLQRAFQTAGARSVVSSLWKVPDKATQALMNRFYANLWTKKMTKVEALRQAQLWMLREGVKASALRAVFNPKTGTGKTPTRETRSTDEAGRPLPHYWAAFVLSGDWR